jgi:Flp pilus assembly protein TadG
MRLFQTRRRHNRRGAAIVEMALTLPVFFMVVLGIIEFGRAMWVSNMVTNSAREGTRMAILDGSSNAAVQQAVQDFLTSTLGINAADISTTITISAAAGNPDPVNECGNANSRDLISITVSVPFNQVALVSGSYLDGTNLVGSCAMRHE